MLISLDPNHNFQRCTLKQYHTQLNKNVIIAEV